MDVTARAAIAAAVRHDAEHARDQIRERLQQITREPGEIHVDGHAIGRLRWHYTDRQTPALPIIVWR